VNADGGVNWQEDGLLVPMFSGKPDYTEYLTKGVGRRPPTTLFFPYTDYTYGATADANSVGYVGALNTPTGVTNSCTSGTKVPTTYNTALNMSDWHNYKLDTSSVFRNAAADGKDMGADISKIEAAQTSTQYTCSTPCGSGPFPD
jgi:hypothetical protein